MLVYLGLPHLNLGEFKIELLSGIVADWREFFEYVLDAAFKKPVERLALCINEVGGFDTGFTKAGEILLCSTHASIAIRNVVIPIMCAQSGCTQQTQKGAWEFISFLLFSLTRLCGKHSLAIYKRKPEENQRDTKNVP
jgi:hypothetical protein